MALLKDLIVQGASRFIGDAYFATIKAGVWDGTPIDLSHGGTAGETTAGKILTSTTTSGTSIWTAASSITVGTATKLSTVSKTAWGQTYWTSEGVPTSISGTIDPGNDVTSNCGTSSHAWLNVYSNKLVSNTTLYLVSAASTSIIFQPQGTEAGRFNTNGNLVIGETNSTTANAITDKLYVKGTTTITGTLTLTKTQDLTGTSNNSPALIIGGSATGVHMEIDSNEIHAKTNGTTTAPLYLNNNGDLVYARGKVLAEQDTTTTSAGKLFISTTTAGRGEWSTLTLTNLDSVYNWYSTMIASSDTDELINRWNEVVDFLNNFTEEDTLASILSTYVTLGTAQTITGAKTFANPISGDLLGNATTADRLKSTTRVGSASLPVYFNGGLPVACTASSIFSALSSNTTNAISITVCDQIRNITPATLRTSLGLGTVYSHAHTDYVTNVSFDTTDRKLQQSKGDDTATDIVTFGTGAFATIADYLPLSGGTMSGSITFPQDQSAAYNSSGIKWSDYTMIGSNTNDGMGIYSGGNSIYLRPGVSTDYTKGVVISRTNLTYNGNEVLTSANYTSYVTSVNYAESSGQVKTQSESTDAVYYLTFVDSNNSSATTETVYTDAGIIYNPSTNLLTVEKLIASGVVNLSGSTTIDSLTAGNLIVTGASSLTGNVSMGTVTAGTWNGSVIDVAHGGTGCSTLTSGAALIGNGTGDVTFRSIDNVTTAGSLAHATTWAQSTNLVTRNTIAYWDGRYKTENNASNLAYCNQGAFGTATTRTYATAISTTSGTTSATVNNYNSDSYVPTNKAVYDFVTTTLAVSPIISKTSITKSLNSSAWTETGYTLYGEEQGSYMLQITDTTTAAVFTGVFSIYHGSSTTGNDLDEIPLHMCANTTNKVRIYAATQNGKLLISSQDTSTTDHTLTIKYKKIL